LRTFQESKIEKLYTKKFYICYYTTFFFYISVTHGVPKHVANNDYYNTDVQYRQSQSHTPYRNASYSQQISNMPLQKSEEKQQGKFKLSFVCKTPRKTRKLDATSAVLKRHGDEHFCKGSVRTSGKGKRRWARVAQLSLPYAAIWESGNPPSPVGTNSTQVRSPSISPTWLSAVGAYVSGWNFL
jgi:hypothetical protein